jgi:hypothetical protein
VQRAFEQRFFNELNVPEHWWRPAAGTPVDNGKMLHVVQIQCDFGMNDTNPMTSQHVYAHKSHERAPSRLSSNKVSKDWGANKSGHTQTRRNPRTD